MPTEASLQAWTKKLCRGAGVLCYKFDATSHRGVPDLIMITDKGKVFFMELKSPNGTGRLSPLQKVCIGEMRDAGATVYVCDNKRDIIGALRHQGVTLP